MESLDYKSNNNNTYIVNTFKFNFDNTSHDSIFIGPFNLKLHRNTVDELLT